MADKGVPYCTRYYRLDFAKPGVDWSEYKRYLKEAVKYASCNLLTRHGIKIDWVAFPHGFYIIANMPFDANFKNPGRRFKGIGIHLLRAHGDIFEELLVGTRLLYYTEIPENLREEVSNG